MPVNLPPILPTRGPSNSPKMPSGPSRAQDFSVSNLRQTKDAEEHVVSLGQIMRQKRDAEMGKNTERRSVSSSSVNHPGRGNSILDTLDDPQAQEEARDRRRDAYAKKSIKERKAKEAKGILEVKTGSGFRKKVFKKDLAKLVRKNPSKYRNISKDDRELFEKVVTERATAKRTGSKFDRLDGKKMKKSIRKAKISGEITKQDQNDFKKIIDSI